jgi:ribosomal protein S18 acetylase RimI-like enzyme
MSGARATVEPFTIDRYCGRDRQRLRDICVQTCWLGRYEPLALPDDWIWAEYWTRYFTDIEPDLTWVVRNASGVAVGYLTGTANEARFHAYAPRVALGIIWRAIRKRILRVPHARRAAAAMLGAAARGDMAIPARLQKRYPAALHLNLSPEARGHGLGRRLVEILWRALHDRGVPGVHAQTISANARAGAFFERAGFHLATRRPTRAYAHLDQRPMWVLTWVRGCALPHHR